MNAPANEKYVKEIITDYDTLSIRCHEFDQKKFSKEVQQIVLELKNTIRKNNLGALSANQLGYGGRIICMNFNGDIRTFINPIFTSTRGLELSREYCSSIPDKSFIRLRHSNIDVTYQTWDDVRNAWLPNVVNDKDYAGIFGHDVCAVYANLSQGNITDKVHAKGGKWYPAVTNRSDYAGVFNKPIDGLMMTTNTGKTIKYRVHLRRTKEWLPWVTGYNEKDHNNGYAGVLGQEIDAIQIVIQ